MIPWRYDDSFLLVCSCHQVPDAAARGSKYGQDSKSRSSTGGTGNLFSMASFDQIKSHNLNIQVLPVTTIMMRPWLLIQEKRKLISTRTRWGMIFVLHLSLSKGLSLIPVLHAPLQCTFLLLGMMNREGGIVKTKDCESEVSHLRATVGYLKYVCVYCMSCYILPDFWQILICTEIASGNLLNFWDN